MPVFRFDSPYLTPFLIDLRTIKHLSPRHPMQYGNNGSGCLIAFFVAEMHEAFIRHGLFTIFFSHIFSGVITRNLCRNKLINGEYWRLVVDFEKLPGDLCWETRESLHIIPLIPYSCPPPGNYRKIRCCICDHPFVINTIH